MHKFKGKWISNKDFYSKEFIKKPSQKHKSNLLKNQHVLFRDYFDYDGIKRVFLYYSADDFANVYINGEFVSQGPAVSYPFHQYYLKIDITKFLIKGRNLIAIHSYYQGLINRAYYSGDLRHGVIYDIVSGNDVLCTSGEHTKTHNHTGYEISHIAGWISENDFNYDTDFIENYDSNSTEDRFYLSDFNDSNWENAKERINVDYKLFEQKIKRLVFEEIKSKKIIKKNHIIYDLKQEICGYPLIKFKGKKGQYVRLLCGEELNEDGSVRYDERCNCKYEEKWTLSGKLDTFIPFTYKAFRYIELESLDTLEGVEVKAIARHYPFKDKLKLKFEDRDLTKIYKLCVNTIKYGVQDSFLDCPSREKGQYFGDGVYSSLVHVLLTKDTKLYKKFIVDAFSSAKIDKCLTAQGPCSYYQTIAEFPLMIVISLRYYLAITNDLKFVQKQKNNVKKLLTNYYKKYFRSDANLIEVYDRWNVVEWPNEARDGYDFHLPQHEKTIGFHNVMNAYYLWSLLTSKELFGDTFGIPLDVFKDSYIKGFYDKKNHVFYDNLTSKHTSLPSMIMGNLINVIDDDLAKENLIKMIKAKGLNNSNLFMTPLMFLFVKQNNYNDLLLDLIKDKNGWINMINENATTTFEAFSKDKKWNTSLLHTMFSFVLLFLV